MTKGVRLFTDKAHPAWNIAKLTRSRRSTADARAACNFPLTWSAAELAATEGMLRAADVVDREVAAPRTPTTLGVHTAVQPAPARPTEEEQ